MREGIDARIDELDRIVVIEDVRDYAQPAHVGFIDDHAIERRRQLGRAAVRSSTQILMMSTLRADELPDGFPRLVLGRHFVGDARVCRAAGPAFGEPMPRPGHHQPRGVELALLLLGAHVVQQIAALDALRLHDGDAEEERAIEIVGSYRA